jgi:uncharacterized phage-associated protein
MCTYPLYSSLQVGFTLLEQAPATHMRLQKLTFLAYSMATYHAYVFNNDGSTSTLINEKPVAYKRGPVFLSMYRSLKKHGGDLIEPLSETGSRFTFTVPKSDTKTREFLDNILEAYGHMSDLELSTICHMKNSAWERYAHDNKYKVPADQPIPDRYIISGYRTLIESHM